MSHDYAISVEFAVEDEACAVSIIDRLRDVVAELETVRRTPGTRELAAVVRIGGGWPVAPVAARLALCLPRERLVSAATIRIRDAEAPVPPGSGELPLLVTRTVQPASARS